jgi:8-oxo-dGTP diphosphatase
LTKVVFVVAGVLRKNNQILLTSRPKSKHYADYWEFPGGKIEPAESVMEALIRELKEELDILVKEEDCRRLTAFVQHYTEKDINLTVIEVNNWSGTLSPCEAQELYFYNLGEVLDKAPLLPTTQKILNLLEKK